MATLAIGKAGNGGALVGAMAATAAMDLKSAAEGAYGRSSQIQTGPLCPRPLSAYVNLCAFSFTNEEVLPLGAVCVSQALGGGRWEHVGELSGYGQRGSQSRGVKNYLECCAVCPEVDSGRCLCGVDGWGHCCSTNSSVDMCLVVVVLLLLVSWDFEKRYPSLRTDICAMRHCCGVCHRH